MRGSIRDCLVNCKVLQQFISCLLPPKLCGTKPCHTIILKFVQTWTQEHSYPVSVRESQCVFQECGILGKDETYFWGKSVSLNRSGKPWRPWPPLEIHKAYNMLTVLRSPTLRKSVRPCFTLRTLLQGIPLRLL